MIRIADDAEFFEDDEQIPPITRPSIDDRVVVEQSEDVIAFDHDCPDFGRT